MAALAQLRNALFEPFASRNLSLPNRIVMSAMGRAHAKDGAPDPKRYAPYFTARIAGGVGMIVTGATAIDRPLADFDGTGPRFDSARAFAAWQAIVAAVHDAGGRIALQLWHAGMERQHAAFAGEAGEGPSGIAIADLDARRAPSGRAMAAPALAATRDAFAAAAAKARAIGFDAVEIHAGHGFLLDQFLWSATNRRTDEYGGSPANRARFPAEVVAAVRAAVGPDFPILVRISQFKIGAYEARIAQTPDELGALLLPLAEAGADIFDCSQREANEAVFAPDARNLAGWARALTGKPAIALGSVGLAGLFTEEEAADPGDMLPKPSLAALDPLCARLAAGEFDLVAIARALLADADWPRKIAAGDGAFSPLTIAAMTELP